MTFNMKKIQKNIYVHVTQNGYNIGCVTGEDGVVSIDLPATPEEALAWRAQIAEVTTAPLRAVIFTAADRINSDVLGALNIPSIVHESAITQLHAPLDLMQPHGMDMLTMPSQMAATATPSTTAMRDLGPQPELSYSETMSYVLGLRHPVYVDVQYIGGYGPGAAFVTVRDTGVIFTGDHVTVGQPPSLAYGDHPRWVDALTTLKKNKKITTLIPGHGPVGDLAAINEVQEYIKLATTRVKALVRGNKSRNDLSQIVPDLLAMYALKPGKSTVKHPASDVDVLSRVIRNGLERIYDDLKQETVVGN